MSMPLLRGRRLLPRRVVYIALFCMFVSLLSPAVLAFDTPERVVQAYTEAFIRGDWSAAAAMFHKDDLDVVKRAVIESAQNRRDADAYFEFLFGPGVNRENVADADPTVLMGRILQIFVALSRVAFHDYVIYGSVYEGPDMAHVVIRSWISYFGTEPFSFVSAATVEKTPDGWRVRMSASDLETYLSIVAP